MNDIGKRLNEARKAKGLKQDQLAALLNVSRSTISHWENGLVVPDVKSLRALSELLGTDLLSAEGAPDAEAQDVSGEVQGALESVQEALGDMHDALAAASDAQQSAQEAPAPNASPKPSRRRLWWLGAAVIAAALCLYLLLLPRLNKPMAQVTVEPLQPSASLLGSEELERENPGWAFTFCMHNESDVAFRPEKATVLFYTADGRIDDKLQMTYDEMRPFMDSDELTQADTPLHLSFGADQGDPPKTRAECVLRGTDANGHELEFRGSVALVQFAVPTATPMPGEATFDRYVQAYAAQTLVEGQAFLDVHADQNPIAPQDEDGTPFWFYSIELHEIGGADFTLEYMDEFHFAEGQLVQHFTYTAEELGLDGGLVPANGMFAYGGGFPVQPFDGIGLIAHGTDADGRELTFYGYAAFTDKTA